MAKASLREYLCVGCRKCKNEYEGKIAQLEEENEKRGGVIEMLMERSRWLQEESGKLYGVLESAPETEYEYVEEDVEWCRDYREWWNGQRQEALEEI